MNINKNTMIVVNKQFQREIFQAVVNKFGGSIKASKIIGIPSGSIRGYKNLQFASIPKYLLDKLIKLRIIESKVLKSNIKYTFDKKTFIKKIMENGRQKRIKKLKEYRKNIPSLKQITKNNFINFEEWFQSYYPLVSFGPRKFNYVKNEENYLEVNYTTHSNKIKKEFVLRFPRRINLDEEFFYFFGLWCGDRAGGKRFGICNKNENLIKFVEYFLKKNYQKIEKILYIHKDLKIPKIEYDKIYSIDKEIKGWVLSVHSVNGIFSSFFHYLQSEIRELLSYKKFIYPFFAGLFDAEGNVSLYNKSFRWACKNKMLVNIYSEYLKKINMYDRYDGALLISYNKGEFYLKILPFLKHTEKINLVEFLCRGKGKPPAFYEDIISYIHKNPNLTEKELAKGLKKNKIYLELQLLSNFGYVKRGSYPYKYSIPEKVLV